MEMSPLLVRYQKLRMEAMKVVFRLCVGGGKLVSQPELNAVYEDIGDACNYWLPSEESEGGANGLVDYRYSYFMYDRIHDKNFGLPVRCVKNYLSESR